MLSSCGNTESDHRHIFKPRDDNLEKNMFNLVSTSHQKHVSDLYTSTAFVNLRWANIFLLFFRPTAVT